LDEVIAKGFAISQGAKLGLRRWIRRRCTTLAIPARLLVERDGRPVAVLDDPIFAEMFWFAWRIRPLPGANKSELLSESFWDISLFETTRFRCDVSGEVVHAFWGTLSLRLLSDGRLSLRGAYAPAEVRFTRHPFLWIWLLLSGGERARRGREARLLRLRRRAGLCPECGAAPRPSDKVCPECARTLR
jgi:hypothetical protein